MKIPVSYKLLAHTIKVKTIPAEKWKRTDCRGLYDADKRKMEIMDSHDSMTGHTWAHELVHSILSAMGNKLNEDESFVDNFSGLLHQAMTTAKYRADET